MNIEKACKNTHPPDKAKQEIPDHVIEFLARYALPLIQAYFDSEDGKRAFAQWKTRKEKAASAKKG